MSGKATSILFLLLATGIGLIYLSINYDLIIIHTWAISTLAFAIAGWILFFIAGNYTGYLIQQRRKQYAISNKTPK